MKRAPRQEEPIWVEVWAETSGLLGRLRLLRAWPRGKFDLYDPRTERVLAKFPSYEDADRALTDDEFTLVEGRLPMKRSEARG